MIATPQIIVLGLDDWIAKQLHLVAEEHRTLLTDVRQPRAARTLLTPLRPTVLVIQVDPHAEESPQLAFAAEVTASHPETAVVIVSDGKLPDDARARWTAALLDLGARYVLFPPLTGPVLEDLIGGLLTALLPQPPEIIDLAEEGTVAP